MKIDTGEVWIDPNGKFESERISRHMNLREYYAGLAMQGLLTIATPQKDSFDIERGVRDSVAIADALIQELNK